MCKYKSLQNLMPYSFGTRTSTLIVVAVLLLSVVGLIGSLKVVLGLFGIEPDTCHSLILWHGIKEYGISWLRDWMFTQDNWLLSLVPLHFIGFTLFGPKASVVIVFGWIIYISSAFVAAAIVWKLGAKRASVFVFLSLINLNLFAHACGFVSYSTSHNITNLFGLTSLLILIYWCDKPRNYLLVSLFIILVCGAVSDPWMLASYNLPLFLLSLFLFFQPSKNISRNRILILIGLTGLAIISTKTKLFGVLYFLPNTHLPLGDWNTMETNAVFLVQGLGGVLNIVPFSPENSFIAGFLSLCVLFIMFMYGIYNALKFRVSVGQSVSLFFLAAILSIGGIILAFIIINVGAKDYSTPRYLINSIYLIIIAMGVLSEYIWKSAHVAYHYTIAIILMLFFTLNLSSNWPYISNTSFKYRDTGLTDTITFLTENGLTYGYGPYWGSNANAVTAASNSKIRIRPVLFDKNSGVMIAGNRPQTSKRWYTEEDVPVGTSEFFVMVMNDIEVCPDINVCVSGLEEQFGKPIKRITRGDSIILVWDHALIGYEGPPQEG